MNLTGQKISLTYGQLLQVIGGVVYDGLGNTHSLTDSFGISLKGSYTGSVQNTISVGFKNYARVKNSGTIQSYRIDSFDPTSGLPVTGSITIDIRKNNVTIGSASMSNTGSYLDTNLFGWVSPTFSKDDQITYSVISNNSIKNLNLILFYNATI